MAKENNAAIDAFLNNVKENKGKQVKRSVGQSKSSQGGGTRDVAVSANKKQRKTPNK